MRLRIALIVLALVVAPVITFAIAKSRTVSSPSATAAAHAPDSTRNQYQALLKQWTDSHPGYSCSFDQPDDANPTSASCSKTTTSSNSSGSSQVEMAFLISGQTSP